MKAEQAYSQWRREFCQIVQHTVWIVWREWNCKGVKLRGTCSHLCWITAFLLNIGRVEIFSVCVIVVERSRNNTIKMERKHNQDNACKTKNWSEVVAKKHLKQSSTGSSCNVFVVFVSGCFCSSGLCISAYVKVILQFNSDCLVFI